LGPSKLARPLPGRPRGVRARPLLGGADAGGGVRVVHQAGDLGLVQREADDGAVALQQALALEQVIRAHALAGRGIATMGGLWVAFVADLPVMTTFKS